VKFERIHKFDDYFFQQNEKKIVRQRVHPNGKVESVFQNLDSANNFGEYKYNQILVEKKFDSSKVIILETYRIILFDSPTKFYVDVIKAR
jgi:hypothetical protein